MGTTYTTSQATLTNREKEILLCIAEGLTLKQIADRLFTDERIVAEHSNNLLVKAGARNTTELVSMKISSFAN